MALISTDWNVVVVGRWNRAILTPAGVAQRLFKLPEGTAVEVLVPLDVIAPAQVKHDGITVIPGSDRLIVSPDRARTAELDRAKGIAVAALEDLPRTPFSAAGVNLRFSASDGPTVLEEILTHDVDSRIADEKLTIESRSIGRVVARQNGRINITFSQDKDLQYLVMLNFDIQSSNVDVLKDWLKEPAAAFEDEAMAILTNVFGIERKEIAHGD